MSTMSSKPVPKTISGHVRRPYSGKDVHWRKLNEKEKKRIAGYYHDTYFNGSLKILLLLFISFIATVWTVFQTVGEFMEGEPMKAIENIAAVILLYFLLIVLSKLLVHRPKRELNAINTDIALVCETEVIRKFYPRKKIYEDITADYRIRYKAEVMLPMDTDAEGNVVDGGGYPLMIVGMHESVYQAVQSGEEVIVVFFPEDREEMPSIERMELFEIKN